MSTTVNGGFRSPEPNPDISSDTMSPTYPDRPIRPLPKRRLRERLSPDVAESIQYPPAPPTTVPLFYYPFNLNPEEDRAHRQYSLDRARTEDAEPPNYISRRNVQDPESDDDYADISYRSTYPRHSPDSSGRSYRYVEKPESISSKYSKPEPPPSATSSVDGYDSFEQTNNKKKRKIPTPGDVAMNGIHLSNDLASLGISSPEDCQDDNNHGLPIHTPSPTTYSSMSGPGRGRYGRVRQGRSPLRTLTDAPNNWMVNGNGRAPPKSKQLPPWPQSTEGNAGIISTAIANAEKNPIPATYGQENTSLLQQASKKSSPASSQFTFTCESQLPGVSWPGPPPTLPDMHLAPAARKLSSHGTQTSPQPYGRPNAHNASTARRSQPPENYRRAPAQGQSQQPVTSSSQAGPSQPAAAPAKPRRRRNPNKELVLQARQRRAQQQLDNYHHPPSPEDAWICEFCEYERIFGTPPVALIRQYEIKDRRMRKQEAERKRLLEKAKAKGRKAKKKAQPKGVQAVGTQDVAAGHGQHGQSGSGQQPYESEDHYYEDDFEEEYAAAPAPSVKVEHSTQTGSPSPLYTVDAGPAPKTTDPPGAIHAADPEGRHVTFGSRNDLVGTMVR